MAPVFEVEKEVSFRVKCAFSPRKGLEQGTVTSTSLTTRITWAIVGTINTWSFSGLLNPCLPEEDGSQKDPGESDNQRSRETLGTILASP